ncbi:hypothetical protein DPQ22_00700 [Candidatus Tokpelaia sp.]|nr:hypothetical protein DPQ22_00700 [Candidatus Tokpelaia sp.]
MPACISAAPPAFGGWGPASAAGRRLAALVKNIVTSPGKYLQKICFCSGMMKKYFIFCVNQGIMKAGFTEIYLFCSALGR